VAKKKEKNPAAVELGRKGGLKKVPKGLARMTDEKRAEIVAKGAAARWGKKATAKKAEKKK